MFAITKKQATMLATVAIFAAVMFVVPAVMNAPSHQASACWSGGCGGWGGCCGGWSGGCGGCGGWGGGWWHHGWGW